MYVRKISELKSESSRLPIKVKISVKTLLFSLSIFVSPLRANRVKWSRIPTLEFYYWLIILFYHLLNLFHTRSQLEAGFGTFWKLKSQELIKERTKMDLGDLKIRFHLKRDGRKWKRPLQIGGGTVIWVECFYSGFSLVDLSFLFFSGALLNY